MLERFATLRIGGVPTAGLTTDSWRDEELYLLDRLRAAGQERKKDLLSVGEGHKGGLSAGVECRRLDKLWLHSEEISTKRLKVGGWMRMRD